VADTTNYAVGAKGDLLAGTAADTVAALAVGNNGETLVADSSTSTGLRYTAGTVQANPFLNSAAQVWQRGTSISYTLGQRKFAADRWEAVSEAGTGTISRQLTGDTTNLPNIQYCMRFQRTAGQTTVGDNFLAQNIETVNSIPFSGKTVTVSYYARAGANFSGTFLAWFGYGTGTDQNIFTSLTGQTALQTSVVSLTTTWQRFTFTVAIPAASTQLAFYFRQQATGTAGAADLFEVTGVQLDIGSVALPFRTYAGTIQGELAACQRYYQRVTANAAVNIYPGMSDSTTVGIFTILFPQKMRVRPTALETSGTPADYSIRLQGQGNTLLSAGPTFSLSSTDNLSFTGTVPSGLTGGDALLFRFVTADVSFLGWSAEL
jgi:hypothetical protein